VSPKRALQRRVPDRARLQANQRAMVAALRWSSRALPFVWLCLSCASIKTLNFSSGTVSFAAAFLSS
jgi:hypothetical protein